MSKSIPVKVAEWLANKHKGDYESGHYCLRGVQEGLSAYNIIIKTVPVAKRFPEAVKNCEMFWKYWEEVTVSKNWNAKTPDSMPVGTIAVYDGEFGHIEVKIDGTSWVSDYIQKDRDFYAKHPAFKLYYPRKDV